MEVSPIHPTGSTCSPLPPEAIHPALWRAAGFGRSRAPGLGTGFAVLDAELPGGGWFGAEVSPGVMAEHQTDLAREANKKLYVIMALLASAKVPDLAAKLAALAEGGPRV